MDGFDCFMQNDDSPVRAGICQQAEWKSHTYLKRNNKDINTSVCSDSGMMWGAICSSSLSHHKLILP
jgi:hypothetical protein